MADTTRVYLVGDSKMWWRTKYTEIGANMITMASVDDGKRILPREHGYRYLEDEGCEARDSEGTLNEFHHEYDEDSNGYKLSTIWAETADNARSAARNFVLGGLSEKHHGLNNFWVAEKIDDIDLEALRILNFCYERVKEILLRNQKLVNTVVDELILKKSLAKKEFFHLVEMYGSLEPVEPSILDIRAERQYLLLLKLALVLAYRIDPPLLCHECQPLKLRDNVLVVQWVTTVGRTTQQVDAIAPHPHQVVAPQRFHDHEGETLGPDPQPRVHGDCLSRLL
ncbi:hypothetical protein KSS87_014374 [Heliosperma pusillum]|nr:hypothetical protein KSS87_014374 [Heliosperma pusillum]